MGEGVYIYCVIGSGEAGNFGPLGVGGRGDPVTTIPFRDLSAVVSSVPMDRYVVDSGRMLAHERVLERVMQTSTVLPTRFCTVAPNAEEVRSLLRSRYPELKRLLRELDNKVELGVRARWKDLYGALREGGTPRELGADLGNGTEDGPLPIEGVRRVALERKRSELRELLLARLRNLSLRHCLNRTYGDDMIMNAAFLVDRTREKDLDHAVEALASEYEATIEFKYVGPVPPYSFVNIVIKDQ